MFNKIISGIIGTIFIIGIIIIASVTFAAFKEVSPNEETKQNIEKVENNFFEGISLYLVLSGAIGLIAIFVAIFAWLSKNVNGGGWGYE